MGDNKAFPYYDIECLDCGEKFTIQLGQPDTVLDCPKCVSPNVKVLKKYSPDEYEKKKKAEEEKKEEPKGE